MHGPHSVSGSACEPSPRRLFALQIQRSKYNGRIAATMKPSEAGGVCVSLAACQEAFCVASRVAPTTDAQ